MRVWTRNDLLRTRRRPDRHAGVPVRIATRYTPRRGEPDKGFYELISPCCAKRTLVGREHVNTMISGRLPGQWFECGKSWGAYRGNPRNGGCRARYQVEPALVEDGRPAAFDLTWTGAGQISQHPGRKRP